VLVVAVSLMAKDVAAAAGAAAAALLAASRFFRVSWYLRGGDAV
jgi:hypothetical protein